MAKQQNLSEQIEAINLLELEMKARELLPQTAYDFYASGANDEITLRENRMTYERITLLPRMLVDVSERHMDTTALGEPVSMPILIAPTAFQGLAHPEGELATVKAAGAANTLMTLSTLSTFSIEEVMAVATGPVWFQLYVFKDRAIRCCHPWANYQWHSFKFAIVVAPTVEQLEEDWAKTQRLVTGPSMPERKPSIRRPRSARLSLNGAA